MATVQLKVSKDKRVIHSLVEYRKPLFGYWDMGAQYKGIRERASEEGDSFNPNNEITASELIDLPTALRRSRMISRETVSDKRYRYQEPYSDLYKNRIENAYLFDPVINQAISIRCD